MLLLAYVFISSFLIMQNLGMLEIGHLFIIILKVIILLGMVAPSSWDAEARKSKV